MASVHKASLSGASLFALRGKELTQRVSNSPVTVEAGSMFKAKKLPPSCSSSSPSSPFWKNRSNGSFLTTTSKESTVGVWQGFLLRAQARTEESTTVESGESKKDEESGESFGAVKRIVSSRVVERKTQYLIEWEDDHADSWEESDNVAMDLLAEYDSPWFTAARKADEKALKELLEEEGRDVNAIDGDQRTALLFASGLGSESCVRMLLQVGADVHWQEKDGYTPLHIAAGYVHTTVVRALLEAGADPEAVDNQGRSVLELAQQLLEKLPKANPMTFARRLALDQVVKALDAAIFEEVAVEQIIDKRKDPMTGNWEYYVRWSDGSEDTWEPAINIGEDLVRDYEMGLEYGIAEAVVDKREVDGKVEYLVKWEDSEENSWEPELNVAAEVIAEFEKVSVEDIQIRHEKLQEEATAAAAAAAKQ